MSDSELVGIFLASSGSRGDRLLFRYPYETQDSAQTTHRAPGKNPYAIDVAEDYQAAESSSNSSFSSGTLVRYSDKILENLLAVKSDLCDRRFEVKINNVLFVGYPMLVSPGSLTQPSPKRDTPTTISFNVAFALQAHADEFLVGSYQDLAKQIAVSLKHEEKRCGYLNQMKTMMWSIQDEVAAMTEDSLESPYRLMLRRCQLAKHLRAVYDGLYNNGVVQLHINNWIQINFCLPHKVLNLSYCPDNHIQLTMEAIQRLLSALRPYHAMLLLVDVNSLLDSLPPDCSPSLIRLVKVSSPLKSLQNLASDADLSLVQVFQLVTHLVYWGKATIIYPLCETNVYVMAPNTNTFVNSNLVERFVEEFPGVSLPAVLAEFSLPTPLGEHRDVLGLPQKQVQEVQMVVWMLQHKMLMQMHTYVFLMPSSRFAKAKHQARSHLLSPAREDLPGLWKASSSSDVGSMTSDESLVFATSEASPIGEMPADGRLISEEARSQWRVQNSLLDNLSPAERQNIMAVQAASNPDDMKLFARLCPYFDGTHHLEEIMYYENVRRSQLLTLLDKFRDVLVTCQHEDRGTSTWITMTSAYPNG